jgi:hypothetical protein
MFSDLHRIILKRKKLFRDQKIKVFFPPMTVPSNAIKIEIPINKKGATHNMVNKVNKLVTVFAVSSCTMDRFVTELQKHAPCCAPSGCDQTSC